MHPASSVIFFTVASGAGYGLLAATGIAAATRLFATHPTLGIASLTLALLLITAGLLSSTFHLGHPERAWRAVSQWRSSWLSREGVAALATYLPAGALWLCLAGGLRAGSTVALLGVLAAIGAAATVFATGKIYAVLKPIREWHTPWTVPVYLAFAASTGLLLWLSLWALFGPSGSVMQLVVASLVALVGAALTKHAWSAHLAGVGPVATRESALGLTGGGTARVLDPPHTGSSFLLEEMGYRVGRKHAARLTRLMWLAGFAIPALGVVLALAWPPIAIIAALSALAGAAIERWLFFATATHTVTLYYR
jgi:DMSO reductase anchor subunit